MKRISYSQYSMWAQCPHRWKTAYVDGHREFTESIHTLFGTSMHEVIQTYLHVMYTETAKKADSLDLEDLLRVRMKKNFESALKQNGQPWYKLARAGIEIERKSRQIIIYYCHLLDFDGTAGWIDLEIHCSKGTYIRSLAETLGSHLGSCAHLSRLRRIKAGALVLKDALTLDVIEERVEFASTALDYGLMPMDCLLSELPRIELGEDECIALIQGKKIPANGLQVCDTSRAYFGHDNFAGLITVRPDGLIVPKRMVSPIAAGMRGWTDSGPPDRACP